MLSDVTTRTRGENSLRVLCDVTRSLSRPFANLTTTTENWLDTKATHRETWTATPEILRYLKIYPSKDLSSKLERMDSVSNLANKRAYTRIQGARWRPLTSAKLQ